MLSRSYHLTSTTSKHSFHPFLILLRYSPHSPFPSTLFSYLSLTSHTATHTPNTQLATIPHTSTYTHHHWSRLSTHITRHYSHLTATSGPHLNIDSYISIYFNTIIYSHDGHAPRNLRHMDKNIFHHVHILYTYAQLYIRHTHTRTCIKKMTIAYRCLLSNYLAFTRTRLTPVIQP